MPFDLLPTQYHPEYDIIACPDDFVKNVKKRHQAAETLSHAGV
jgi:hypothetical protein